MNTYNHTNIINILPVVDGYRLPILQGGSVIQSFLANPITALSIYNGTDDYIEIVLTVTGGVTGNVTVHINPRGAQSVGQFLQGTITSVTVNDALVTGQGGGIVILNGFSG